MALELRSLSKRYKDKIAVDHVDIAFSPGVSGLLGANGAGKTTLMRMVTGILTPTSGQVLYDGIDIATLGELYRDMLGYLPQSFGFYPEFTVKSFMEYMGTLKGLSKAATKKKTEELLYKLKLEDVWNKHIRKLSGGMQKRVGIAQALLNDPHILILDEPTSGLDPEERIRLRNILAEFAQERMVLISTHIVSDVESIANQNAIMKNGVIIAHDTTDELLRLVDGKVWQATIETKQLVTFERTIRVVSIRNEDAATSSLKYVADTDVIPNSRPVQPRLEDLYFWLFKVKHNRKESGI